MITLDDIVALCKYEVSLTIDFHTCSYKSLEEAIEEIREQYIEWGYSEAEFKEYVDTAEMLKTGHIVNLQAYPRTPIGSISVNTGSIQSAIDLMYKLLMEDRVSSGQV